MGLIDIEGGEFDVLTHEVLKILSACEIIENMRYWVPDIKARYPCLSWLMALIFEMTIIKRADRSTVLIPELRSFAEDNRRLTAPRRRPYLMRFLRLRPRRQKSHRWGGALMRGGLNLKGAAQSSLNFLKRLKIAR